MGIYIEARLVHVPSLRCSAVLLFSLTNAEKFRKLEFHTAEGSRSNLDRRQGNLIEASRAFSQFLHVNNWTKPQIRQGLLPSTLQPTIYHTFQI
jgi:hypothetical protein